MGNVLHVMCRPDDFPVFCRLSVVTEALQGKSRWLRKAPLELSHPDRAVFEGQQTVLLFAAGSAAKEQWFVALNAATSADGGTGSSVHALYNTFCDYVRENALVAYPEVCSPKAYWCIQFADKCLSMQSGTTGE